MCAQPAHSCIPGRRHSGPRDEHGSEPALRTTRSLRLQGQLAARAETVHSGLQSVTELVVPPLLGDIFTGSTQYDALNRPSAATTPDGSVTV